MHRLFNGLNAAQQAAVKSEANVLQVLAPPGSGKTKTLTSRVAYLLQHSQYMPWDIICLTFTIKSSREMRDRIAKLLGNGTESRLILGTFHSVCRRYLVTYGHFIGISKDFGIADTSDTIAIIKRIIKRLSTKVDPKQAQARISHNKSKGITHIDLANEQAKMKKVEQQDFVKVFAEYQDQLVRSNLLDYDDLLLRCADLLRSYPSCVSNVEAVLIDEFQDTNVVQFDLMRLFAHKHKRVTTVGDPDQSIYGWRSAESKNLKRMQKHYPDTVVINLEDNYRSSGAILLAASEVIEQDQSRPQKPLLPTHGPGTVPVLRRLPSAETEAAWIASEIQRTMALMGGLLEYSDFAILLRSASLSRLIESKFANSQIPYRMVGGHKFYDRVEIKILLDYLRVISRPDNNDAVARIVNTPSRGVGETTVKAMLEEAEAKRITLWQLIENVIQGYTRSHLKISNAAEKGLGSFRGIIISCRSKMLESSNPASPEELLRHLTKKLDFKAYLEKHHNADHEARWANVEELVAQAAEYRLVVSGQVEDGDGPSEVIEDALPIIVGLEQSEGNAAGEALSRLLANVALATDLQREKDDEEGGKPQSQVTITTIHSAKGLEWPVVFVPSAYNGCIPHSRAEDNDEERRLLYVAMTRAQALLYTSCPTKNSQHEDATLSAFLSEKKIQYLLSNRGPTIEPSVITDVARILRRDCPSQEEMIAGAQQLIHNNRSCEDNQWPLDGSEDAELKQSRWNRWDHSANDDSGHASKRRKVGHCSDMTSVLANPAVSIGATTTMQRAATFSTGFTTASAQMQQIDEQAAHDSLESEKKRKPGRPKSNAANSEDSNLLNLWGKKKPPVAIPPTSNVRSDAGSLLGQTAPSEKPNHHERQHRCAYLAISQRPPAYGHHTPIPLHASTTKRHRARPAATLTTGHPSSTRKLCFPLQLTTTPEDACQEDKPAPEVLEHAIKPRTDINVVKPAQTFHKTSMAQAQGNAPRKTLGVRRSMAGWHAAGRQGFSVPRMRGGE